ncbi:uncharacterized protein PITG_00881 [Phytophthora infestans T30-4]|uniref:Uncharacterized protein n=1 Tax=Phytophthora infestans (strain T30-4) TaxID=403677 RepID=D0MRX2_PHYIT|nr:uncharacterized protein PITG_00881 [Phytophthora infestans T30-4]EEY58241.1 hypothetical protein PITG_00881 [Phytophthora infestans T30-4]|eukprot:XP_002909427.1 hypothetical protein PITG_00881 [Phytophthora infestans T30-4]
MGIDSGAEVDAKLRDAKDGESQRVLTLNAKIVLDLFESAMQPLVLVSKISGRFFRCASSGRRNKMCPLRKTVDNYPYSIVESVPRTWKAGNKIHSNLAPSTVRNF